jgi:23S rRNA (uracil747-C5)-methyltransferase
MINGYSEANCSYFKSKACGSCALLDVSPEARFSKKMDKLTETFAAARIEPLYFHTPVMNPDPWGTRHKVKMSVTGTAAAPVIGVTGPDRLSRDLIDCHLSAKPIALMLTFIRELIQRFNITPYDIERRHGELKYLIITSTSNNEQGILRFVLRSSEAIPRIRKALPDLKNAFPWLRVVSCNIQPLPAAILEGPEEIVLTEHTTIRDSFAGVPLYFAPQSFMQVTPSIAQRLYQTASTVVAAAKPEKVVDLFCGVGGFSLSCARYCGAVTGVEISPQAIECATKSSSELNLNNTNFIAADVDLFISANKDLNPQLVITNPPRRGLSKHLIEYLLRASPKKIVYSSCNPETFCRDASFLKERYKVEEATPFDMFPMTEHWEILGVLCRR